MALTPEKRRSNPAVTWTAAAMIAAMPVVGSVSSLTLANLTPAGAGELSKTVTPPGKIRAPGSIFTRDECEDIYTSSVVVLTEIQTELLEGGKGKLDARFPDSYAGWLSPTKAGQVSKLLVGEKIADVVKSPAEAKAILDSFTCNGRIQKDGKVYIFTPGVEEVTAFNSLRGSLLKLPGHYSLAKAGLVSVDPAKIATRAPVAPVGLIPSAAGKRDARLGAGG